MRRKRASVTITQQGPVHEIEQDFMSGKTTVKTSAPAPTSAGVSDTELKLRGRAQELHDAAERAVIDTDEAEERGSDLAKLIRVAKTKLEDERKAIVKPFNDGVKAINDRFKIFTNTLDKARSTIDRKMINYAEKKAEEARKVAEAARVEAEVFDFGDGVTAEIGTLEEVPSSFSPARGSMSTASVQVRYDFKVVDIKLVPPDLLLVDGVRVRQLINGPDKVASIPGIEILEVKNLTVR